MLTKAARLDEDMQGRCSCFAGGERCHVAALPMLGERSLLCFGAGGVHRQIWWKARRMLRQLRRPLLHSRTWAWTTFEMACSLPVSLLALALPNTFCKPAVVMLYSRALRASKGAILPLTLSMPPVPCCHPLRYQPVRTRQVCASACYRDTIILRCRGEDSAGRGSFAGLRLNRSTMCLAAAISLEMNQDMLVRALYTVAWANNVELSKEGSLEIAAALTQRQMVAVCAFGVGLPGLAAAGCCWVLLRLPMSAWGHGG